MSNKSRRYEVLLLLTSGISAEHLLRVAKRFEHDSQLWSICPLALWRVAIFSCAERGLNVRLVRTASGTRSSVTPNLVP